MRYILFLSMLSVLKFCSLEPEDKLENVTTFHITCKVEHLSDGGKFYRANLSEPTDDGVFWLFLRFPVSEDKPTWEFTEEGLGTGLTVQTVTDRTNYSQRAISGTGRIENDTIKLRGVMFKENFWTEDINLICR